MRIAYISQYFYPEQFSNNALARSLVDKGHDVDVITCVPNYPEGVFTDGYSNKTRREDDWCGVRIHRAWTIARGQRAIQLIANYLAFVVTGIWTARKVARKHRPDISFVSMPSPVFQALVGIYLKRRFKVPLVYWVQDIWPESATYSLNLRSPVIIKPLTWLCGWIYRQADHIMVQSDAFPPMIMRFGVPSVKVSVFPNTAAEMYQPVTPDMQSEEAEMMPATGFRIIFAGNIGESQDFDTIIATAKELGDLHNVQWIIIGSGRDCDRVIARVKDTELDNRFHFLGRFPESRMPHFFAHADAMLVSLKRNNIFALTVPYKVQTYLACGKPVIASLDGEGARVISEAQAGVVAPTQSPQLLAQAITTLVQSSQTQRQQYGNNGRAYFEQNYASEILFNRLEKILADAVT
ncbi:glycosyltransferase family 4 protein [Sulfitobacter sp.]|uniref:glycosyltransferase family 4 protein n=1 Tax=Sulfitobacter sp. TaxID=1903071 RepID=UPI00405A42F0|tara:strand:+ start:707 stop:1930 length:1224 start_codon:yes stop_codon:yes gene_type:complete